VSSFRSNVLLCDEDRDATDALSMGLRELGHAVTLARSCADTFAAACTYDFSALVVAPFLRDGSALVLPAALGIRKPRFCVLTCRMTERLSLAVSRRVGFDLQLTKVIDPRRLDRLLRTSIATVTVAVEEARELGTTVISSEREREAPPPGSEVGARAPR
jgi:DNA-binding response OmpR family regulator